MADPIKHVIVLVLENHSFDQMLGCMKEVYPAMEGISASAPLCNPDIPSGQICQAASMLATIADDPGHDLDNVLRQIAGPCKGFISDFAQTFPQTKTPERQEVMGYYPKDYLPVLHTLAEHFAICDHWFSSVPGPTWTNRFFIHSGTSLGRVKMPGGIFHPNLHLYDQTTVFDRLQARNISWDIYYGDFPQTMVMTHQWKYPFHYHTMSGFAAAVQGEEASFPQYCFIEPTFFGAEQNDEHPPKDLFKGEALIAQIYNLIRSNNALWNSSLFVLLYDEHGGFADHVYPPAAEPPDNHVEEYAFNQYGVRVPALLISPWVKAGVISDIFDHTSLLKYLTDKWQLGPLGSRTAKAATFGNKLTELTAPRTDTPAVLPVPQTVPAPATAGLTTELNANQQALLAFSHYLESKMSSVEPVEDIARRTIAGAKNVAAHVAVGIERVDTLLGHLQRGWI